MAASASYIVRSPQWVLSYLGVNISADVSEMVVAIRYVDRLGGASGELEVELEDSQKRWQGPGIRHVATGSVCKSGTAIRRFWTAENFRLTNSSWTGRLT